MTEPEEPSIGENVVIATERHSSDKPAISRSRQGTTDKFMLDSVERLKKRYEGLIVYQRDLVKFAIQYLMIGAAAGAGIIVANLKNPLIQEEELLKYSLSLFCFSLLFAAAFVILHLAMVELERGWLYKLINKLIRREAQVDAFDPNPWFLIVFGVVMSLLFIGAGTSFILAIFYGLGSVTGSVGALFFD